MAQAPAHPPLPLRIALSTILPAVLAAGLAAQEGPAGQPAPAPAGGARASQVVREETVYVPYEKLEEVFEETGRGIFLPYEEFLRLWQAAQPKPPEPPPDVPPASAVIRRALYTGTVEGEVARFEVTYAIEALKKGWSELFLPLTGIAVETVGLSNAASLFATRDGGYAVYLPEAGAYEVKLVLSARVGQEPGKKAVRFGLPAAGVSRLEVVIPEEDVRVDVEPAIAVTQTTSEKSEGKAATRVLAFLGNATEFALSWTPALGKAGEGGEIVFATQKVLTVLAERILKVSTAVDYEVKRGEVDTFRVRIPENTRVISVDGENMREWVEETIDGAQALTVRLHSAVKMNERYRLSLSFERILEATPPALSVPFPRALGALRESGDIVLGHETGLNVRVVRSQGLSQLDPEQVPEDLRARLGVGFRYLAHPLALDLSVEEITPVVRNHSTSVVTLGAEEDVWLGWIDYDISKAGVFRLEFRVPAGWSVASVGDPATTEKEFQTSEDGRTISVSLKSKALGAFRLPFRLTRDGSARPGELTISPPEVLGSVQDRGLLGLSAPKAIEVRTLERQSMLDADRDELFRSGIMGQLSTAAGIPLTYRYREQPASVRLQLDAKATEIDVLAQHLVEVGDGEIVYTHLLDYEVLFAPVGTLKFRAPSRLDDKLQVESEKKTEVKRVTSDQGQTVWEVTLQPPTVGVVTLTLTHTQEIKSLEAGTPWSEDVPIIHAVDARAESGFIAIRKEGTLEIVPQASDMEVIDMGDLPDKLRRGRIYSAFRYFAPEPKLKLELTLHHYQRLATTAVQLIRMKSVLTRERKLRTGAVLLVQNTERTYLQLRLPPDRILQLSVAGKSQSAKKASGGDATLIEIPRSAGAAGTFPVEIVYEEALADSDMGTFGGIEVSSLEVLGDALGDVPVGRVELELWLPPEYRYMAWSGSLTERFAYEPDLWSRFKGLLVGGERAPQAAAEAVAAPGGAPPGAGGGGVEIDIPTEGLVRRDFKTLAPVGTLGFWYSGRRLFAFLDFLACAGALAGAYLLFARRPWPRARLVLVVLIVPGVLAAFAGGALRELLVSVLAGGGLVCLGHLLLYLRGRYQDYRAARLALAPDPFLEEAPGPERPASVATAKDENAKDSDAAAGEGTGGAGAEGSPAGEGSAGADDGSKGERRPRKKKGE
jgi:hypothetical protein